MERNAIFAILNELLKEENENNYCVSKVFGIEIIIYNLVDIKFTI